MMNNKKLALLSLVILAVLSFSYKFFYMFVDEFFMEVPACNRSSELEYDNVTAHAGCLITRGDEVLLVKFYNREIYSIPGGRSKFGETAACTAHRETYEEAGVNVKVLKRIHIAENGFNIFECELIDKVNLNYQKQYEIDKVAFTPVNKIENYRYGSQLEFITEYLNK